MANLSFLSTGDAKTWAGSAADAAMTLPYWVEELVKAGAKTPGDIQDIRFPKEKFTTMPGVDGVLACTGIKAGFDRFIPVGDSVWEVSVDGGISTKVTKDGLKRSESELKPEEKEFVFVTPLTIAPTSVDGIVAKIKAAANCLLRPANAP